MPLSKLSERKIQTIQLAASTLFQQHGYHRVTMDEISIEAHVSKATLYKYFSNKQELYEDIYRVNYLQEYDELIETIQATLSFEEKINRVIRIRLRKYFDHSLILFQNEFSFSESMQSFIKEHKKQMEDATFKLYEQGRVEGCIRKDMSDETLKMYFKVIHEGLRSTFDNVQRLAETEIISLINVLYAGVLECPKKYR